MAATLEDRLTALPAELYNQIFQLTSTTDQNIHTIDGTYKPPSCLQVNRSTRAAFAKSYYGLGVAGKGDTDCTVFYIDRNNCAKWLRSLTQRHVNMLEEVRYRDTGMLLLNGSSEAGLKIAYDNGAQLFYCWLIDEIGATPTLDPAQLCIACKGCTKDFNRDDEMNPVVGENKYRSISDLKNGLWSTLAKDDVPNLISGML